MKTIRQQNNGLTYELRVPALTGAPEKRESFVLSKEQTLVDLFRNNSLACMGDFKRAICIFLFLHAPFFSFCFGIIALIFGIFSITTHYKIIFFVKGSHNTIDMGFLWGEGGSSKGSNEYGESMIIIKGINHAF